MSNFQLSTVKINGHQSVFLGGFPARASEINSETAFALQYWGVQKPEPIEELLVKHSKAGVCLVDHQQTSQLNKSVEVRSTKIHIILYSHDFLLF